MTSPIAAKVIFQLFRQLNGKLNCLRLRVKNRKLRLYLITQNATEVHKAMKNLNQVVSMTKHLLLLQLKQVKKLLKQ